ncbi:MAG: hypothetical protein Q7T55_20550 [Solirubrobacteraceae bacterium]|nr:hypothetical protein [Solirubrobacteraceae bacterium]
MTDLHPTFSEDGVLLRKHDPAPAPGEEDHGPELPASVARAFTATFVLALVAVLLTKSPVLV